MSFYGGVMVTLLGAVLVFSISKWKKLLMVIIILEMGSLIVLSSFYILLGAMTTPLMLLLVFLVGEALVILSAFYFSLQSVGLSAGTLLIN